MKKSSRECPNISHVCCKPPQTKSLTSSSCGRKRVMFDLKSFTNREAEFGEFPWMVLILTKELSGVDNNSPNYYTCGGSLIHKRAVLTAAHCVIGKEPDKLQIRVGEWNIETSTEEIPHQDRNVQSVIVHDKFSSVTLRNDFAILILSEPVNLADHVDVICLPERNTVFDGSQCFATGWGKDIFGKEGQYQVILKKIELPVVPRDRCQDRLRTTRLGKYFILDESFICAGGEANKDTCTGDGGSPLVCPSKNDPAIYMQAGIVAWGIGCGQDKIPSVYANVALARDWIDEQMAFNNLDNTVYQPPTD
ncbi:Serine proteinase stubble [Eufriesea mexicana]|uniref:Phenoloxidase-activating factor 2 n=2 Tax=Eufriesea mexicana TaxID=516756 RepID=A0A310SRT1_9HYME|nr:Serine proteinase stubble [Eufriesea mexicana]